MPVYNLSVPGASPFLRHFGSWSFRAGGSLALDSDSSLNIPFHGTGISLSGMSPVDYTVTLDSNLTQHTQKQASQDAGIPVLFSQNNLGYGPHVLNFNKTANAVSSFNLITVNITTGDGDESTTTQDFTMQNTHPNITYSSSASHSLIIGGLFSNSSVTALQSGYANISFYGNDIALYGALEDTFSQCGYTVTLDGQDPITWPAQNSVTGGIANLLLYQSGNLTTGDHYVLINPVAGTLGGPLMLDYAVIRTYVSTPTSSTTAAPSGFTSIPPIPPRQSTVPVLAIAGGAIGGVLLVIASILCTFYFLRRRFRPVADDEGNDARVYICEEDMPPPDYTFVFQGYRASRGKRRGVSFISRSPPHWNAPRPVPRAQPAPTSRVFHFVACSEASLLRK